MLVSVWIDRDWVLIGRHGGVGRLLRQTQNDTPGLDYSASTRLLYPGRAASSHRRPAQKHKPLPRCNRRRRPGDLRCQREGARIQSYVEALCKL